MAAKKAGVIVIEVVADTSKLGTGVDQATQKLGRLGTSGKSAVVPLAESMLLLNASITALNSTLVRNGAAHDVSASGARRNAAAHVETSRAIKASHDSFLQLAGDALLLRRGYLLLSGAVEKYSVVAATSATTTDNVVNAYRAVRLALAPTPFTVATIAVGVLAEATIGLVMARAKLIDQQALFAASNKISFSSVDSLDSISKVGGKNQGNVRSLYTGLQSQWGNDHDGVQSALDKLGVSGNVGDPAILGRIAEGFHAIEDPVKRDQLAVELFGSQAGMALQELDGQFATAAKAVDKWGYKLDEISRTQIHQMRQDWIDQKNEFLGMLGEMAGSAAWEGIKTQIEQLAAAMEDASKWSVHWLTKMLSDHGIVPLVAPPLPPPPPRIPGAAQDRTGLTIATQDTMAGIDAAKQRHDSTIEGQRGVASAAERRSQDAIDKIKADDTARESYRTARQANPNTPAPAGLLEPAERFALSQQARSGADLAKVTSDHVKVMESAKEIAALLRDRFSSIHTELQDSAEKVKELGLPPGEQRQQAAREYDAQKKADELNKQARETIRDPETGGAIGPGLSASILAKIKSAEASKEAKAADERWLVEIDNSVESTKRRTEVQNTLNAAIGKGTEATKAAAIETHLMEKFGADYKNPTKQTDIGKVRDQLTTEGQAKDSGDIQKRGEDLGDELKLELRLADAQLKGADAVTAVHHAETIRLLEAKGLSELVDLENALFDARKKGAENAESKTDLDAQQESIDKLDLEIEGENALAAAQYKGAEAVRNQELANKLAMLDYDSASTKVFDTLSARTKALADLRNKVTVIKEALSTSSHYSDELDSLNKQLAIVKDLEPNSKRRLELGVSLRDVEMDRKHIEDQISETLAKQALAVGKLSDGLKAFFTDANAKAEKFGQILYDGMNHAVDGFSDSLEKAMTGQKAGWGAMFKGIGDQMLKDTIKSSTYQGIGALGKKFPGLKLPGAPPGSNRLDGQTAQTAKWVRIADNGPNSPGAPASAGGASPHGKYGDGSDGGFIFNAFKKLFHPKGGDGESAQPWTPKSGDVGGLKRLPDGLIDRTGTTPGPDGLTPAIDTSISYPGFATGTDATPANSAYWVGEHGPELEMNTQSHAVIPMDKIGGGGDTIHNWNVDARGSDIGVTGRINQAMDKVHQSAVKTATTVAREHSYRTPQKG